MEQIGKFQRSDEMFMHPSSSASDRAVQKQRRMAAAALFPEAHLESRAFAS